MDEFQTSVFRYAKGAERRARAHGMSSQEWIEKKTSLLTDVPKAEKPKNDEIFRVIQMEDLARESSKPLVAPLPSTDAIVEITIREPKGVYRFTLEIPKIGTLIVDPLRSERGYKGMFMEAILYRFFGVINDAVR